LALSWSTVCILNLFVYTCRTCSRHCRLIATRNKSISPRRVRLYKESPVSCHGRLFKPERLSAPDKKTFLLLLEFESRSSSFFFVSLLPSLLACSLARSLVGSLACSLVGCCWLSRLLPCFLAC